MGNSEKFIKYYTLLESKLREKYGYDDMSESPVWLASENELKKYKEELNTLRIFRNVLSHSKPFGVEYCAEAHDKLLETLKNILIEVDDAMVIKTCVTFNKICFAGLDDNVVEYMNKMRDNVYTHIPILDEKKRVIGVFGESTLFSYVLDAANIDDIPMVDCKLTFRDIEDYIKIEAHKTEGFIFVGKYSSESDCRYEFKKMFNSDSRKRLGMMFITENGKQSEGLLGIKTAWGMLGRETLINT